MESRRARVKNSGEVDGRVGENRAAGQAPFHSEQPPRARRRSLRRAPAPLCCAARASMTISAAGRRRATPSLSSSDASTDARGTPLNARKHSKPRRGSPGPHSAEARRRRPAPLMLKGRRARAARSLGPPAASCGANGAALDSIGSSRGRDPGRLDDRLARTGGKGRGEHAPALSLQRRVGGHGRRGRAGDAASSSCMDSGETGSPSSSALN